MTSTTRLLSHAAATAAVGAILLPTLLLATAEPTHASPLDGIESVGLVPSSATDPTTDPTAEDTALVDANEAPADPPAVTLAADTTAPTVTVTTVPAGVLDHGIEMTLDFACADPESGVVSCLLEGRSSGSSVLLWESGNISWTLEAVNGAGLSTSVPVDFTVRPDVTGPGLREDIDGDLVNGWYTGPVTVIMTTWDPSGTRGIWSSVDGAPAVNSGSGLENAVFTTDGAHVVEYWAFDPFGNRSVTRSVPVRLDTTAPRVVLPTNNLELRQGQAAVLDASCTDEVAGVETSGVATCEALLDGVTPVALGDALPTSALGRHEVVLTATDAAGHRSAPTSLVYTVVAGAVTETPARPLQTLAATGADPALPSAAALALVALGAGLLGLRRLAAR